MDVSNILASHAAKFQSVTVEKETPLDVDTGFLTVTDLTPIDEDSYKSNLEEYLQTTARDGIQALVAALYGLPTQPSPDGPLAQLPAPTTQLPRAKPLPKPKPPTKWERFAAAKGIQKRVREKKVWDEERQEWVNRWGKDGKNKEKEEQWIHEVKADAPVDHDPIKAARDARTSRVAKNERQRLQNNARAQTAAGDREERKKDIEKTLAATRINSTRKLDGEKKLRGVKRKFEATETSVEQEKQASLAVLSKLDGDVNRARREKDAGDGILNVRRQYGIKGAKGKRGGKR
ncbi:ribosome biogenesis regulatory protein-domain-containing protein [Suillus cothurnatus]|nr:ribosome biogenesis regulatory protein-domain-containing protein [Suillus cothurnatus]